MGLKKGKTGVQGRKRSGGKGKGRGGRRPSLQKQIARALGPRKEREPVLEPATEPMSLPAPEQAVEILRELAEMNHKAVVLHAEYEAQREEAKHAKEAWEQAVKALQQRLEQATHPAPMPLFDQAEREADQERMEAAAADPSLDLEPGDEDASVAF